MNKLFPLAVALSLSAVGGPIVHVYIALAPNPASSAYFSVWETNAVAAMRSGGGSQGMPGTPGYFEQAPAMDPDALQSTGFPSWQGEVNPGASFGASFAGETGTWGHFPVFIDGDGTQFSLAQLSFDASSSDPANMLGFDLPAGSFNYGTGFVGVLKGLDGSLGTPDDVLIAAGPNSQLVDGLYGRGAGNAFSTCAPGDPVPCGTPAERQAAMDAVAAYFSGQSFTGVYMLRDANGRPSASGTAAFEAIPEPATWLLVGAALALWLVLRR